MEILLVYMMYHISSPANSVGPEVSENIFNNVEECQTFVNSLVGNNVFTENRFQFAAEDGVVFHGGCMTPFEYELYKEGLTKAPINA